MQKKFTLCRLPPVHTHCISEEEQAWLDGIKRQLAHDEYMQAVREAWLFQRPPKYG